MNLSLFSDTNILIPFIIIPILSINKNIIYRIYLFQKLFINIILLVGYYFIIGKNSEYLFDHLFYNINQNGCLIIKLVQWFTTRLNIYYDDCDYKPKWLINMNKLYENCIVHDLSFSNQYYKELTGKNLDEDYELNDNIVSSGSIGQVYRFKSKYTNQYHAIKVKHPDIDQQILVPKFFIKTTNKLLSYIKYINHFIIPIDLNGFFDNLEKQSNFNYEVENMKIMQNIFKDEELIVIPEVINNNSKIIIMTFEEGTYYDDLNDISDFVKYKISILYMLFFHQCCLISNFNHGDLHRGNWKVRVSENKKDYKLVIYDFGVCYKQRDKDIMKKFIKYWEKYDIENLCNLMDDLYIINSNNNISKKKINDIKRELNDTLTKDNLKPFCMSRYLKLIYNITTKKGLVLDYSVFNLIISILLCEDMFRKNGLLNRGTEIKDTSGISVYQETYNEYINFCQTKKCFPTLCQYYKDVVIESGIKYTKLFGNLNKTLEIKIPDKEFNLTLDI